MKPIAFVIPAYKVDYFQDTLESLVNQTCHDFTIYIGDDASPNDFQSIVNQYNDKLDIVYKRFDENLGGKDLVAHWKRCIDMTKEEPWIWLFSDDDILGKQCVERILLEIKSNTNIYDIYHFDVKVIDSNNNIIRNTRKYPGLLSAKEFYKLKGFSRLDSYVVENVFSRNVYNQVGGFEYFDLAWGSDTATWVKMAYDNGIKTIQGEWIYWRQSNINITPNLSPQIVMRKLKANINYFRWGLDFFKNDSTIKYLNFYYFLRRVIYYSKSITSSDLDLILAEAIKERVITKFVALIVRFSFFVNRNIL